VQVRDHDKPRLGRDAPVNLLRVDHPSIFFGPRKAFHIRFQIPGDIENWAVCRLLDQNLIARFDDRSHRQVIGQGSPRRFHDAFGINAVVSSDGVLEGRVAITIVAINFEFLEIYG
jgi:hypothetical protein